MRISVARDDAHGFITDDLGSFLCFGIDDDLVGSVNLIIGENAILKHEPPWPPSFAVVHPLLQYPRDSVPYKVVDPHVNRGRGRQLLLLLTRTAAFTAVGDAVIDVAVAVALAGGSGNRIRSPGGGERRHGEAGERTGGRRGFDRRSVIGDGGYAAERMHIYLIYLNLLMRRNGLQCC